MWIKGIVVLVVHIHNDWWGKDRCLIEEKKKEKGNIILPYNTQYTPEYVLYMCLDLESSLSKNLMDKAHCLGHHGNKVCFSN